MRVGFEEKTNVSIFLLERGDTCFEFLILLDAVFVTLSEVNGSACYDNRE